MKEIQRGIQTQRFKGGADESGVLSVIVGKAHVQVGEVAAAIASGEQLAANTGLPLQQRDAMAALGGGDGGHEAGGPAADNDDIHGWLLSPQFGTGILLRCSLYGT